MPGERNGGTRWGAIYDVALDPSGNPWAMLWPCGQPTCETFHLVLFRVDEDTWTPIIRGGFPHSLAFDTHGRPWLCTEAAVYHVAGETLELFVELFGQQHASYLIAAGPDGRVWAALMNEPYLWVYEVP